MDDQPIARPLVLVLLVPMGPDLTWTWAQTPAREPLVGAMELARCQRPASQPIK
jgi:hypothetical protein